MVLYENRYDFIGNEKGLQELFVNNIDCICKGHSWPDVKKIHQQFLLKATLVSKEFSYLDVLLEHVDGSFTIVEVKNFDKSTRTNLACIGQILHYGVFFTQIYGIKARLLLVTPKQFVFTQHIIETYHLPIETLIMDNDNAAYCPLKYEEVSE